MAVFRVEKTRNYTVMSNYHLRDKSLSLKAKGLLSLMLSLPEDWDYTTKGLARICKDGVDSICATVRELEGAGYIVRERERHADGTLGGIEYTILEQPREPEPPKRENPVQVENTGDAPKRTFPEQVKPVLGKPEQENPAQLNIQEQSKEILSTDSTKSFPSLYYRVVVIRAPLQGLCYTVRDAVDWLLPPTARRFRKGSNHSPLQYC